MATGSELISALDAHSMVMPGGYNPRADQLRRDMGLLSEDDLCALIGVKLNTLRVWRVDNEGPRYTKLGRSIFYRRSDIEAWIAANLSVAA